MQFEIALKANTRDEGGITGSLQSQLDELGGTSTLIEQGEVVRVDTDSGPMFEVKNLYQITL